MAPPDDTYSAQADAFCAELGKRIEALDNRAAKLKVGIAQNVAEKRPTRVARLQNELRDITVERREVITLLTNLGHGHPCDHGQAD